MGGKVKSKCELTLRDFDWPVMTHTQAFDGPGGLWELARSLGRSE